MGTDEGKDSGQYSYRNYLFRMKQLPGRIQYLKQRIADSLKVKYDKAPPAEYTYESVTVLKDTTTYGCH